MSLCQDIHIHREGIELKAWGNLVDILCEHSGRHRKGRSSLLDSYNSTVHKGPDSPKLLLLILFTKPTRDWRGRRKQMYQRF